MGQYDAVVITEAPDDETATRRLPPSEGVDRGGAGQPRCPAAHDHPPVTPYFFFQ